jgi:Rod binding domain-containing protein
MVEKTGALSGIPVQAKPGLGQGRKKEVDPLEKACRQFEGIFLAALLKQSRQGAFTEKEGPFRALEETSMEMTAEAISGSGEGLGLWRVLYENLSEGMKGGEDPE